MIKYIVGFLIACIFWILVLSSITIPEYRIYDCGMAEWHPDIPKDVKEECRQRRLENLKNQQSQKHETTI